MKHWGVVAALLIPLVLLSGESHAQPAAQAATDAFRDDVHARAGLSCTSCHSERAGREAPYSAPRRADIAAVCARCHSDAAFMRRFAPQVRIDQFAQYLTSTHGKRMAAGETRVATCSDCHGAHGVRRVTDARSSVAPVNVAKTCARCHADTARMAAFERDAAPYTDWSNSVHAAALLERGDTSAPSCSTCHGSHGATPPGVSEVANVCSQCHVREADLFRSSPKKPIFDAMNEAECLACHGNHRIESPSDAWIGLKEPAVCAKCHDETVGGARTILEVRQALDRLATAVSTADAVLARAERAGMLVEDGRIALREAREHQIHSRVLVHAFATRPLAEMAGQGFGSATRAEGVGEQAMRELQVRHRGLAVATIVIVGFLASLWLKIRRLPEVRQ